MAQGFENAVGCGARQADFLCHLGNGGAVAQVENGERVEPKDAKDPAVILKAVKLAKDRNISYGEALTLARGE